MYCPKCGTELDTQSNFCPKCGNRIKKNKYLPFIIGGAIFVVIIVIALCMALKNEVGESNPTSSLGSDTPMFSFAVDGYVEIQEGEITEINVKDYLPIGPIIIEEGTHSVFSEKVDVTDTYYYSDDENGNVNITWVSSLVPDSYTDGGILYYDKEADCLARKVSVLGINSDNPYLIPMGKKYTFSKDSTENIQDVTYLFTVSTPAGKFEDCVAVINSVDSKVSEAHNTVTFYAPNIGRVLTVMEVDNSFIVYMETLSIVHDTVADNPTSDTEESLDMPDQGQIEYDQGGDLSSDEIRQLLPGSYADSEENTLNIIDNGDYSYKIEIELYRLAFIEGAGYFDNNCIYFTGEDPSGNLISGYVELGGSHDESHLVFTDSKWDYIENWSDYYFTR